MLRMKIIGVILLVILSSAASFAQDWPKVRPMEAEVGFDTAVSRFDFRVPIYSENGELLYWFLCKGGNTEYLDSVKGGNYVGPLSCRLDTENREGDGSYLAEGDENTRTGRCRHPVLPSPDAGQYEKPDRNHYLAIGC